MEKHEITVTEAQEDCGETVITVTCTCGYTGTEAAGQGCWQFGHNEAHELDATHAALLTAALVAQA